LEECIAIIRQLYEDREGWLAPFPWCEEFRFNLDNIFTRLKFVSRRKEKGTKTDVLVDMFQIFQSHEECSKPRRVLIEGKPGMGKTTYCHKIAYDWAKKRKGGESFHDVILVLLLKCRDINCGLREAIDDQLLPREMNEEEKERFFTFIRNHQSKVLLVLDGLDELPSSQMSIYKEIIQGRVLPESYIVVTARHEFGVKVQDCCHTLLEVEGFTKTDAKEYIQRYFKEEEDLAAKLLDKLDSDTSLQELTANPLNTTLLCLLCEESRGKLPGSRTLLYLEMVECVLRRYRLKTKSPVTEQDLIALYQAELKQLGCIAMEGLQNNSLYFDESAFQGFSSDLISGLGFLSVEAGRSKRRPRRSYGFLHKSFQEFFAALYLCGQLLDGQISVDSLISDRRYFDEFQQVLMFTSGMLAQKCEAAVKALIAGIATQVNLQDSHLEVALACINECKREDNTFYKEVAHFFGSHLRLQRAFFYGLHKELAAVCIETIKTNSTITALYLCHCGIDDESPTTLAEQLKGNLTLTFLDLSNNAIGKVGADALAKGLRENSTLTELTLSYNAIGNVGAGALAKGLEENSTLIELYISNNAIGNVGADAVAKGLKENRFNALQDQLREQQHCLFVSYRWPPPTNPLPQFSQTYAAFALQERTTLEWRIAGGKMTSSLSKLKHLFAGLGLFVLGKSFVRGLDNRSKNSNRIFLSTDYPAVKEHIVHLLADVLRQEDFEEDEDETDSPVKPNSREMSQQFITQLEDRVSQMQAEMQQNLQKEMQKLQQKFKSREDKTKMDHREEMGRFQEMLKQYEENLHNERIEKTRLSEDYESKYTGVNLNEKPNQFSAYDLFTGIFNSSVGNESHYSLPFFRKLYAFPKRCRKCPVLGHFPFYFYGV
ncbi:PREDICTED: nucleotide-binding oligomerization domain-containing protein 2-like, partial [Acropora digitifera]|uniref:nucleotide-binding oligomerization domain-containing protein 2-like n=1 Tax=Acropora digitifera TaxID=70779 RepID=UPI00077AB380